jgi:hypothetical protein
MSASVRSLSAAERSEVARLITDGGLIAAVAFVREVTDATLDQAIVAVGEAGVELGAITATHLGTQLSAEDLAIGPFSKAIACFLPYSLERYEGVPEGTIVIATVIDTCGDTEQIFELATCLGSTLGISTRIRRSTRRGSMSRRSARSMTTPARPTWAFEMRASRSSSTGRCPTRCEHAER